jgi:hypothetical protein
MGEAHQRFETKGTGTALYRMDSTKHGIDRFGIAFAALDRKQSAFEFSDLLFAFLEVDLHDGSRVHGR